MKFIPETIGDQVFVHIKHKYGSQRQAAIAWGMSQCMVSQVVNGRRNPSALMLQEMGLERQVVYVPKESA